ncbi:MAG: hypothetical protein O3C21_20260 [Verrucomicrobia bacterium]|nr:hypothetical protein [Verrucomicrobiota bacterium]
MAQDAPDEALVDDSESIRRIEPSTEATDRNLLTVPDGTANLEALGIEDLDELEDFDTESEVPLIKPVDSPARTTTESAHDPEQVPRNQRRQTLPGGPPGHQASLRSQQPMTKRKRVAAPVSQLGNPR